MPVAQALPNKLLHPTAEAAAGQRPRWAAKASRSSAAAIEETRPATPVIAFRYGQLSA